MVTFDTPYEGIIKQNTSKSKIIIKLQDAQIESSKIKKLSTKFLKSMTITPMAGYTQIVADVPSSVHFIASKTADSYGLRLRFTDKVVKKQLTNTPDSSLDHLPTKKSEEMSNSYYLVVGILVVGIIIMLILKNKITKNSKEKPSNAWLFKNTKNQEEKHTNTLQASTADTQNNISIRFQKDINSDNSVIMLDFDEQSYLILMGKSNILLDKFSDNKPTTQNDFETILQSRHKELDDFLKVQERVEREEPKEPLQSYKEKAASMIYTQDD